MSDTAATPTQEKAQLHGLLAEYKSPGELISAASKVRDGGYRDWDTYTPFPVHGIDRAMGIKPTILPVIVLVAGLTGCAAALLMQWWTNAYDYKWIVSGKPYWSLPANIPITFELTVLFAAISCFLGMLVLNKLPRPAHPLDHVARFARVTDDRFFLMIEASDPKFDAQQTQALLDATAPVSIEQVFEDVSTPAMLPKGIIYGLLILATAALVPFSLAALARESITTTPRFNIVPDMDFQTKFKAQRSNPFFADGRSSRTPVPGTVAVGHLDDDDHFYRGKTEKGAFVRTFPAQVKIDDATMARGKERFGIYCTPCHAENGQGGGMVHVRAASLNEGSWVPPSNLTEQRFVYQPVGELFNTISHGIRNMPAYGRTIKPEDRWAIILYLRALQRSQGTSPMDVPEAERRNLK
jgi:mono/diheme cytochrome c family protein